MYVVMPVPASVKAAITPTLQPPNWVSGFARRHRRQSSGAAQVPTPRLANGKPDMTGSWTSPNVGPPGGGNRRCGPTQTRCEVPNDNFVVDYAWISPSRYWMGQTGPSTNPSLGQSPRAGHVDEQVRSDHDVPADGDSAPGRAPPHLPHGKRHYLVLYVQRLRRRKQGISHDPTDGRQHNANQARQATYLGYSVGKWEGDTLVVDSISFVDSTWLGRGGLFHSGDMRIVEKFTRKGNEILHEMTIHDPESFVEPWVMPAHSDVSAPTHSSRSARIARSTKRTTSTIRCDTDFPERLAAFPQLEKNHHRDRGR